MNQNSTESAASEAPVNMMDMEFRLLKSHQAQQMDFNFLVRQILERDKMIADRDAEIARLRALPKAE